MAEHNVEHDAAEGVARNIHYVFGPLGNVTNTTNYIYHFGFYTTAKSVVFTVQYCILTAP